MKSRLAFVIIVFIFYIGSSQVNGAETVDFVETLENGRINWTEGVFQAKGVGSPPEKMGEDPQGEREKALNASRSSGLKNMVTLVLATNVTANASVRDIASKNDIIMANVESLVNRSKLVKQEYLSDGTVEVTLQMSMFGGFAQLILPEEIKQIESIKTVSTQKSDSSEDGSVSSVSTEAEVHTGLIVDARGAGAVPALVPIIVDENGKEVYGPAFVSREFAVQQGMSRYMTNIKAAMKHPYIEGNPLVVKGLGVDAMKPSRIVISNSDASKLLSTSENLLFLKKCRVVIVVD